MKKEIIKGILAASVLLLCGCGKTEQSDMEQSDASQPNTVQEEDASYETDIVSYEAEDAKLLGAATVQQAGDIAYVDGLTAEEDGVSFAVQIEETGFYDLNVVSRSVDGSYKENDIIVDGTNMGKVKVESNIFTDSVLYRVYLEAGNHEITVKKNWGWIFIDKLQVEKSEELDESRFDVEPVLVNPNADDNAKRLMAYLCDSYGTDILSGQYCDGGMNGVENLCIYQATGKYPAILGLDMMDYTPSRVAKGSKSEAVEKAIEYWNEGGIVTFCWHWNAPEKYLTGEWYSGFYKDNTNIDLAKIMNGEDEEGYELLMQDIDAIAVQLAKLQDAGVPVLWRPLHEASGGWFWWGACGAEPYKELYKLLYDKLTKEYELNNLIWVWNGQNKEWYPGDEYVDIIGEDIYPGEHVYTSQVPEYAEALDYTDTHKLIVMSENGCLFDPDLAIRDGAMWGYFGTWSGDFVEQSGILSEQYTEEEMLKKVYEHEHVITRDELPDLTNYPLQ